MTTFYKSPEKKDYTLMWENKATGEKRSEVLKYMGSNIWQSQTDNRFYTHGFIGWYDITDTIHLYDLKG